MLNYQYKFATNGIIKPHAVSETDDKLYTYDPSGNMLGWTHKRNGTRRAIAWNEENRVKQIDDNGKTTYFLYDDAGERVIKRGQHGETVYINRFYAIRNGELGTKHVFAGETRVLSKLVKTPPTNTTNTANTTSDVTTGTTSTIPGINGLDNGRGKKLGIIRRLPDGYQAGVNPPVEKDQFYYHGDHLGSSNIITDAYGAVYQHLEYFPYAETWVEEGANSSKLPGYMFTGKELDPETGLYYYGARYYDPVLSRWISADPILGKYLPSGDEKKDKNLPSQGGIFKPINLSLYSYAQQNPIILRDLWGEETLGVGIEVPPSEAIIKDKNGRETLDLSVDTGHTYVYVLDKEKKTKTQVSFGPGESIMMNLRRFKAGQLKGRTDWPIGGKRTEYEAEITPQQYQDVLKWMDEIKKTTPNYTPEVNCTTIGVLGIKKAGISLPGDAGKGPVIYPDLKFGDVTIVEGYKGNVANP